MGEVFDLPIAIEVGYLDWVVDSAQVLDTAMERATMLASLPRDMYRQNKEFMYGTAFLAMRSQMPLQ